MQASQKNIAVAEARVQPSCLQVGVRNSVAPPHRKGFSAAPRDFGGMNDAPVANIGATCAELATD